MTIREIEKSTFAQAKSIAIETVKIKEHDCFFVELGEHFGYSVLVFKNGRHIYHANDYELLHSFTVEKNGKEGSGSMDRNFSDYHKLKMNKSGFFKA